MPIETLHAIVYAIIGCIVAVPAGLLVWRYR